MKVQRRRLWSIAAAVGLALVADSILVWTDHHRTPLWGSGLIGYWPVFAVFWFLVFVFGSKWIGKLGVQQREDYYAGGPPGEDDAE